MSLSDSFIQLGQSLTQEIEETIQSRLQESHTLDAIKAHLQLENTIHQVVESSLSNAELPSVTQELEEVKKQLLEQSAVIDFYKEVLQKYKVQIQDLMTSQEAMHSLIQEQNKKIKHLEKENMSFQSESAKNRIFFVERYEQLQEEIDALKKA